MPNPTWQNASNATLTATTSWTISKPSGVVDDDFLLMAMVGGNAETVSSAPAGWTLLLDQNFSTQALRVYWKIAASEGASWTWTLSANSTGGMQCHAFRGTHLTAPIDASDYTVSASDSCVAPTVTPTTSADLLACIFASRLSTIGSASTAAGMTERSDISYASARLIAVDTEALSSAVATGTRTSTITSFVTSCIGFSLLLRPPTVGSGLFFGNNF